VDLTVCISTFGDESWKTLAMTRALPSALGQASEIVHTHAETLYEARNRGADKATGEWLVMLDADDELAPGYVDAILAASGDLRAPAVSWVTDHSATAPRTLADRNIETMNPCVIGTAIRRELFLDLGGFKDWPAYEDWCLYLRATRSGAVIEHVPDAVYRAWVTPHSRNQTVRNPRQLMAQIKAAA
jgi:glycosyltransferase involved in cell wall biosynthesis